MTPNVDVGNFSRRHSLIMSDWERLIGTHAQMQSDSLRVRPPTTVQEYDMYSKSFCNADHFILYRRAIQVLVKTYTCGSPVGTFNWKVPRYIDYELLLYPDYYCDAKSSGEGILAIDHHVGNWSVGHRTKCLKTTFGHPARSFVFNARDRSSWLYLYGNAKCTGEYSAYSGSVCADSAGKAVMNHTWANSYRIVHMPMVKT
ncbi:hypothetical protein BJ138DRAFT_1097198 [Hygrophoropsis aurantiaca]|uniref:Uncharacterized protein n=1 Tax=Hygrophoropsis aurantiaca TaxID=72124 RepID=A0ACB8ARL3_9AGAM|nr:hypothetical protein BJ138DRAFT_1097198 [Hygrophoropsis aurantiaca]